MMNYFSTYHHVLYLRFRLYLEKPVGFFLALSTMSYKQHMTAGILHMTAGALNWIAIRWRLSRSDFSGSDHETNKSVDNGFDLDSSVLQMLPASPQAAEK